ALVKAPAGRAGRPAKSLTLEQAQELLRAAGGSRLYAYLVLSVTTGLRTGNGHLAARDHPAWRREMSGSKIPMSRNGHRAVGAPAEALPAQVRPRSTGRSSCPNCGTTPRSWTGSSSDSNSLTPEGKTFVFLAGARSLESNSQVNCGQGSGAAR